VSALARLLLAAVRGYQRTLAWIVPVECRFFPSCSCYFADAVKEHGALRGGALGLWRVLRCQPLCKGGYDPVPPRRKGRGDAAVRPADLSGRAQ